MLSKEQIRLFEKKYEKMYNIRDMKQRRINK